MEIRFIDSLYPNNIRYNVNRTAIKMTVLTPAHLRLAPGLAGIVDRLQLQGGDPYRVPDDILTKACRMLTRETVLFPFLVTEYNGPISGDLGLEKFGAAVDKISAHLSGGENNIAGVKINKVNRYKENPGPHTVALEFWLGETDKKPETLALVEIPALRRYTSYLDPE